MNSRLGIDALSNYLRFAVTATIPFLLTPRMLEAFGSEGFGLWSLTHSLLSLFTLLDLGLSSTLVRFLSGQKDVGKVNRLVGTVLTLYLGLSFMGLSILAVVSSSLCPFAESPQAFSLLWLLGLRTVTIALPFGVLRSTLHARQDFVSCNLWQAILSVVYGALAWTALSLNADLIQIAKLMLFFAAVEHVGYFLLLKKRLVGFRIEWLVIEKSQLKTIWSFSMASTLSTLAGLILLKTDPLIVAFFLPLSAVTSYTLALKIAEGLLMLLKQGVNVLAPRFAAMWAREQKSQTRSLYLHAGRLSLMGSALLGLPLLLYTPQLFKLWLGQCESEMVLTARILVLAALLSVPQMISSAALTMCGHHIFTARAALASTLMNLLSSVILVQFFGIVGVALGTLITTLVIDLAVVTRKANQILSLSDSMVVKSVLAPLLGPLLIQSVLLLYTNVSPSLGNLIGYPSLAGLAAITTYILQNRKDIV